MLRARLQPWASNDPPLANLEPSTKGFFSNSLINSGIFLGHELNLRLL